MTEENHELIMLVVGQIDVASSVDGLPADGHQAQAVSTNHTVSCKALYLVMLSPQHNILLVGKIAGQRRSE